MKKLVLPFLFLLLGVMTACDDDFDYRHREIYSDYFRDLTLRSTGRVVYIIKPENKDTTLRQGNIFISAVVKRAPIIDSFAPPSTTLTRDEIMATVLFDSCFLEDGKYRQRYGAWYSFKTKQRNWLLQAKCLHVKPLKKIGLDFKSESRIDFDWFLIITLITSLIAPFIAILATRYVKKSERLGSNLWGGDAMLLGGAFIFFFLATMASALIWVELFLKIMAAILFSLSFIVTLVTSGVERIVREYGTSPRDQVKIPASEVIQLETGSCLATIGYYLIVRLTGMVWGWWLIICLVLFFSSFWMACMILKNRLPIRTVVLAGEAHVPNI